MGEDDLIAKRAEIEKLFRTDAPITVDAVPAPI